MAIRDVWNCMLFGTCMYLLLTLRGPIREVHRSEDDFRRGLPLKEFSSVTFIPFTFWEEKKISMLTCIISEKMVSRYLGEEPFYGYGCFLVNFFSLHSKLSCLPFGDTACSSCSQNATRMIARGSRDLNNNMWIVEKDLPPLHFLLWVRWGFWAEESHLCCLCCLMEG